MQTSLNCPNCEQPTFSFWRKQTLGPARSIKCKKCKAEISVGWRDSLPTVLGAPLLIFLVVFVAPDESLLLKLAIFVIGVVLMVFYHHHFVPLIVRSRPASGNS